jgi:hypothetical protein
VLAIGKIEITMVKWIHRETMQTSKSFSDSLSGFLDKAFGKEEQRPPK